MLDSGVEPICRGNEPRLSTGSSSYHKDSLLSARWSTLAPPGAINFFPPLLIHSEFLLHLLKLLELPHLLAEGANIADSAGGGGGCLVGREGHRADIEQAHGVKLADVHFPLLVVNHDHAIRLLVGHESEAAAGDVA